MRKMLAALFISVLSFGTASAQTSDTKTSDPDTLKETSATETAATETAATETATDSTEVLGGREAVPAPPAPRKRQTPDVEHRWGLSLHAGAAIPHGDFNDFFEPGASLGVDLEYRVNNNVSLEAIFNYNRFTIDSVFSDDHAAIYSLSANVKYYGGSGSVRPFVNGGGGVYVTDSGNARPGLNLGAGLQFNVSPKFAVEGMYNFHNVFFSGASFRFSTVQGGVRFRF